jgi:hypothetical protein
MNSLKELEKQNRLSASDLNNLVEIFYFHSTMQESEHFEALVQSFLSNISDFLKNNPDADREKKKKLMDISSKFKTLHEISLLRREGKSDEQLERAGIRLGRKAQSAFGES